MNTYWIAKKNDSHVAINIRKESLLDELISIQAQGYAIVSKSLDAQDPDDAVAKYLVLTNELDV